ncbi:MAG: hypothetical protein BKP49_04290 [Treponema sp. CETP13]|nr:MAG: hypothetical protein BKP49_04290 [Treponema sp. CETP13]
MKKSYIDKVALLVEVLPFIAKETCFALKGGTAINLFYRNMPRLSVDIDLTYVNFDDHDIAYLKINKALDSIVVALKKAGYSAILQGNSNKKKVIVSNHVATIKIEPNYIIRGYVYEPQLCRICQKAETDFSYADYNVVFNTLVQFIQTEIQPFREFLLDFVSLKPDFSSIRIPNLERLPAVCW